MRSVIIASNFLNLSVLCGGFVATSILQRPLNYPTQGLADSWCRTRQNDSLVSARRGLSLQVFTKPLDQIMEQLPSDLVISAVEKSPSSSVIASDIAVSAGVSLSQARKDLMRLAAISQGDIAVDSKGELIYKFPDNLRGALAETNTKFRMKQTFGKIWPRLFWAIRVSFGVALLASLLLVFSTIFFLQTSSNSTDDDRQREDRGIRVGGGGGLGYNSYWWGSSPFDIFYYRPYGYYAMPRNSRPRDPSEMGFLESIFSYVFGDGDPNRELETRRLQLASNVIRNNNGAVTAEQLAPFCDPEVTAGEETSYVNENFVLPIVTALNGEAQVTDDGDIVYTFPDLQVSTAEAAKVSNDAIPDSNEALILKRAGLASNASSREISQVLLYNRISTRGMYDRRDLLKALEKALSPISKKEESHLSVTEPSVLLEREYSFSLASDTNKLLAGGLGAVNLGGALYLGNLLSQFSQAYGTRLPSYFGTIQVFYPLVLGYAILYNLIPLARNIWIQRLNVAIQQRNERRRQWSNFLSSANRSESLQRKLLMASRMGSNVKRAGNNIVFDTSRTSEDNEQKKQLEALQDFDKLLEGDNDVANNSFQ